MERNTTCKGPQELPLDRKLKRLFLISVAQFRPEKAHLLQLRALALARQEASSYPSSRGASWAALLWGLDPSPVFTHQASKQASTHFQHRAGCVQPCLAHPDLLPHSLQSLLAFIDRADLPADRTVLQVHAGLC